jgi:uncharacterized protein (DUF1330 family)
MPKAYLICYVDINDQDKYDEYRKLATIAGERYGATYIARGGKTEVFEGELNPQRVVIIEFADAAAARRWYDSPEYTKAREARKGASKGSFVLVEAVE